MQNKGYSPKISIIVPAYNSEKTVNRAINGLINQSIINCEIVVVNDGSTDNTQNIISDLLNRSLVNSNNTLKLINQENKGLGGARNTGIENSTSNYITFLDADDTLDINIVKEAREKAVNGDFDIVMFKYRRVGDQIDFLRNLYMLGSGGVEGINRYFYEPTPASAWARVYNREFLLRYKLLFPEKRYHEDLPFVSKAYYMAKRVSYINKIGYDWIVTDGSITSSINSLHIDGIIDSLLDIKNFLYEQHIVELTMRNFIVYCSKHINNLIYKIGIFHDDGSKEKLMRYLRRRMAELNINKYDYFLWKNYHVIQYIKNLNRIRF